MFTSPDNRPTGESLQDTDLDFTKPGAIEGVEVIEDYASIEEKLTELHEKIAAADRGIDLAKKLNDNERLAQMQAKKEEFEATVAMLTHTKSEKLGAEQKNIPKSDTSADDFDNALRQTGEMQEADRLDAARNRRTN